MVSSYNRKSDLSGFNGAQFSSQDKNSVCGSSSYSNKGVSSRVGSSGATSSRVSSSGATSSRVSPSGTTSLNLNSEPLNHRRQGSVSPQKGGGFRGIKVVIVIVLVLVIILGGAYAFLYNSSTFEIKSVEVKGAEKLSSDYLTELIDISEGSTLFNVRAKTISDRLSSNPWISSATVKRKFPDTLVLVIKEASPSAVVKLEPDTALGAIEYWLVDSDAVWMSKVTSSGIEQARKLIVESTSTENTSEAAAKIIEETISKTKSLIKEAQKASESSGTEDNSDKDSDTKDTKSSTSDSEGSKSSDSQASDSDSSDSGSDSSKSDDSKSDDSKSSSDKSSSDKKSTDKKSDSKEDEGDEEEQEPSVCEDAYITVSELSEITVIEGVTEGVVAQTGEVVTDEGLLNAIGIITKIDQDFSDQIYTIEAATDDTTSIMLKSGIEIAFGEAVDVDAKVRVIKELLEEHAGSITYINVRVVSNPVWRGL